MTNAESSNGVSLFVAEGTDLATDCPRPLLLVKNLVKNPQLRGTCMVRSVKGLP